MAQNHVSIHNCKSIKMCTEFKKLGIFIVICFIVSIHLAIAQMKGDDPTPYIVGGSSVSRGTFPWVVSITYFDLPFCGGTILNENYVLTAAHCIRFFSSGYKIIAGEHSLETDEGSEQTREVVENKIHPGFDMLNLKNDIGLIRVNESFKFNTFVQPATIANSSFIPESSELVAIGWGLESETHHKVSDEPLKVNILLLPTERCKEKLHSLKGIEYNAGVFCGGGRDGKGTCFGDSGSPIHSGTTVYGLASATAVCAREHSPAIYTKISHFSNWIESRIT